MTLYGGRALVPTKGSESLSYTKLHEKVSVLSYNIMRQMHATPDYKPYCDPSVLTATRRKDQIFEEILSYNADIICLQEVDDFQLWWVPRLNAAGYDSVYHQRSGEYDDGLVIAFRRMYFQIFRTLRIEFNEMCKEVVNDDNLVAKLEQGNVALLIALQPWEQCAFPSALSNLQLASHPELERIRLLQIQYLMPRVEKFNSDFQMPLVICGSFNAIPSSDVYHIMRTGRPRPRPEPPRKLPIPTIHEPSASTLTIRWEIPSPSNGPILAYRIDRRVNGSTSIGFSQEIQVDDPLQTELKATMLSTGTTYEFRIAAKNYAGWGEYSSPSLPIETLKVRQTDLTKPPVVIPLLCTPRSPFQKSYGSGKTPRYTDGQIRDDMCPRPSYHGVFDTLHQRGDREEKLLHFEVLESAYGQYFQGSEPDYTYSDHVFVGTVDYIFYSKKELEATEVLLIPPLKSLRGLDAREQDTIPDIDYARCIPRGWDDKPTLHNKENPHYSGAWSTKVLQVPNRKRYHTWLPNDTFSSDHIGLFAVLSIHAEELAVAWN